MRRTGCTFVAVEYRYRDSKNRDWLENLKQVVVEVSENLPFFQMEFFKCIYVVEKHFV